MAWDRFLKYVVLFCGLSICAQIFLWRPYFGLMDDHLNLFVFVPKMQAKGIWQSTLDFLRDDITWGMFRVLYPPMVYAFYSFALAFGALAFFQLNFIVSSLGYIAMAFVFSRMLKRNFWAILLVVAAFFYAYDLYQHPSLQEKLMHLAAAPLLWFAYRNSPRLALRTALLLIFLLLGLAAKSSFFIFVGMAWLAFLYSLRLEKRSHAAIALSIVTLLAAFLFILCSKISHEGIYTARLYSLAKVPGNLFSTTGALLLLPALLGLVLLWKKKILGMDPLQVLPALGVLAYLGIFLPWGIGGYIQTLVAPVFATLIVQICEILFPQRRRWLWILPIAGIAIVFSLYRPYSMFRRLHDVGEIAKMGAQLVQSGVDKIQMPCAEATDGMKRYFSLYGGGAIQLAFHEDPAALASPSLWMYDQGLCPLPGRVLLPQGCSAEYLYESRFRKGFVLARLHCQR